MHPYLTELLIAERVRERVDGATARRRGRLARPRFLPQRGLPRPTWKTRTV